TKTTKSEKYNCSGNNPLKGLPGILQFWENLENTLKDYWKAPDGIFWICGQRAYSHLPAKWRGNCTLGIIQPGFFLLPPQVDGLGIPVY
ncbi:ENR1 protein, partial [Rostratula benghalensis]|nr:ENR1 protein [Rostratula benghalensis]